MPNSFFGGACPTCHHAPRARREMHRANVLGRDIMGPRRTADADLVMIALGARLFEQTCGKSWPGYIGKMPMLANCGDSSLRIRTFQCSPQIKSQYVLHSTFLKNNSSIKLPALIKINHAHLWHTSLGPPFWGVNLPRRLTGRMVSACRTGYCCGPTPAWRLWPGDGRSDKKDQCRR